MKSLLLLAGRTVNIAKDLIDLLSPFRLNEDAQKVWHIEQGLGGWHRIKESCLDPEGGTGGPSKITKYRVS